ncbi:tetratricopeptide repeat protein [bacterium]|nr:tetratricopeptide repeat protein [bacterium]
MKQHLKRGQLACGLALYGLLFFLGTGCAHVKTPTYHQELEYGIDSAQAGLWKEARFRFQNLVIKNPSDPIPHNNLAVALEALGLFEEAETEYVRALELDPNNAVTHENYERLKLILKEKVKN